MAFTNFWSILPPYPRQMAILNSLLLITVVALVAAVGSTPVVSRGSNILFEGRLPWDTELSDLDSYSTSPYNAEYVIGAGIYIRIPVCDEGVSKLQLGQKWSDVVKFPLELPSFVSSLRSSFFFFFRDWEY